MMKLHTTVGCHCLSVDGKIHFLKNWGMVLCQDADIATTLGYYTHCRFDDVKKEVKELERKLSGE